MDAPKIGKDKCSILIAEYATGHVVKKDLTIYLNDDYEANVFQLFDNVNQAEHFISSFIKINPQFECSIYNHNGEHLKTYDTLGERKF